MANIDRPMDDNEALLSCPHANPKFHSETQMPRMQISANGFGNAYRNRSIVAPACIRFFCFSRVNEAN
jgi:hypothetical protein